MSSSLYCFILRTTKPIFVIIVLPYFSLYVIGILIRKDFKKFRLLFYSLFLSYCYRKSYLNRLSLHFEKNTEKNSYLCLRCLKLNEIIGKRIHFPIPRFLKFFFIEYSKNISPQKKRQKNIKKNSYLCLRCLKLIETIRK